MSRFQELQHQIDELSSDELKEMLSYLNSKVNESPPSKTTIKWKDIRGLAPNLLNGEDAQAWVNRMRS